VNHKVELFEMVGMVPCALLSLAAFLPLLIYGEQLPVALALVISLACPALWMIFLLRSRGGGGGLTYWVGLRSRWSQLVPRWGGQPAAAPVES
jgi:hypothetical protein